MKKKTNRDGYHTLNIPLKEYNLIKQYCNQQNLLIGKFIASVMMDFIDKK